MSEDVQVRIRDAAIHLFAQHGYGGTSVRAVVEAAGVTKPTLYYWYDSKEGLYLACVRHQFAQFRDLVTEIAALPLTPAEKIQSFIQRYLDLGMTDMDGTRLALTATHPSVEKRPQVDIMSMHLQYISPLEQLIQDGINSGDFRPVDPRFATIALLGAATMQLKAALNGLPTYEQQAQMTTDFFLYGVCSK
ncbi:MAG: TetR family transcriptional regulator [Rhodobacterales bacterium]|nr:TetR family transcriptional regulator [Rhodobacterales bacterium]